MVIRRAMLFAAGDRYAGLLVNFAAIAVASRLLTPQEIGVSVLGATITAFVEILRDIPTSYLVRQDTVARSDVQTAFTAMLAISAVIAAVLVSVSGMVAAAHGDPGLAAYLWLLAAAYLIGPLERPPMALLRRELEFGRLALINLATIIVLAGVTILLAAQGFGYLSFGWAALAGSMTTALLSFGFRPQPWMYRLTLREWRTAVHFGGYATAWALARRAMEAIPYVLLGRLHGLDAVGLYGRALLVSDLPDKFVLQSFMPVLFPALAREHRAGRTLAGPLSMAVQCIVAVQWPALLVLACLAHPVVAIMLGPQWIGIVPIVQILAVARLFSTIEFVLQPVLMAAEAMRTLLLAAVIPLPLYALIMAVAARGGAIGAAACMLIALPLYAGVGLVLLRGAIGFDWRELARGLGKGVIIAGCSVAGPLIVVAAMGTGFALQPTAAVLAGLLAIPGWLLALRLTRHPLHDELALLGRDILHRFAAPPLRPEKTP